MAPGDGKFATVVYGLAGHIANELRIAANSNWQEAWKRSEQTLQEEQATDQTPPRIVLLSPDVTPQRQVFRVDTYQIFVRGRVTDDSGVGTVLVNGSRARVAEDGSFAKKVRLALGTNQLTVQAEDIHGNISERTFTMVREEFIPDDTLADVDIPPNTGTPNPDALGVVIGIEQYQYVAPATYAYNDAEVVREYLAQTMGFGKDRLKLLTNTRATMAEINRLVGPGGWLARNVVPGKSDVVVYFSGHGLPEIGSGKVGLLPFDVDPAYSIGLALNDLYQNLAQLGARSVMVILYACFSGQTRERQLIVSNARGIAISPPLPEEPRGLSVFTAASGSQVSGALVDQEHGLFTYHLLKGLGGGADANSDGRLTTGELASFVADAVPRHANQLGWEQTPQFEGQANLALVQR